jgi:hypothetical protein
VISGRQLHMTNFAIEHIRDATLDTVSGVTGIDYSSKLYETMLQFHSDTSLLIY